MKETLKRVEKAFMEIEDYAKSLDYKIKVNNIDIDRELVTFIMRKCEIIDKGKYGYTKRCYERKCQYRYSTGTYVIDSEDVDDYVFDAKGCQIGGVLMF